MERKERKSKKSKNAAKKVRNMVAVDAHFRSGAGAMGGGKKTNNKKDRKNSKQNLKKEY